MQPNAPSPSPRQEPSPSTGGTDALLSFLSAAAFAYFGFFVGMRGVSDSALYNASVNGFTLMAKGLAIGLFIVAALNLSGARAGLLLDAVLSGIAALASGAIGIIWLAFGDTQGVLLLIIAGVCATAATSSIRAWRVK
ncbi:MAG: hypothetical protein JNG88_04555 [Phycisphaerales bacterium]|nr:hypothetical protein [Phycisphaerales bacterium]